MSTGFKWRVDEVNVFLWLILTGYIADLTFPTVDEQQCFSFFFVFLFVLQTGYRQTFWSGSPSSFPLVFTVFKHPRLLSERIPLTSPRHGSCGQLLSAVVGEPAPQASSFQPEVWTDEQWFPTRGLDLSTGNTSLCIIRPCVIFQACCRCLQECLQPMFV